MATRPGGAGRWPEHLPVGAVRVGRSSTHYDQTIRFYRDLVGLPVLERFAASYGEDGTIFGLPDTSAPYFPPVCRQQGGMGSAAAAFAPPLAPISGRLGTRIVGVERTLVAGQDWSGRPSVSQARYPRLSRV
jgi:hypothetical protein